LLEPGLPHILGYESKWIPDSPYWAQISYHEANINDDVRAKLFDYSNLLFERCGCRDYARFDFRTGSDGEIKLLEVNPNPGWCWDGKLNYMAGFEGLRYADLLKMIIETAQERIAAENGFSNNVSTPKEKTIPARIPILNTHNKVKASDADLRSQNLGA
jgi:D-alanine-D-alanine ligase